MRLIALGFGALTAVLAACGGGGGGGSPTAINTPPACISPQVLQNGVCVTPTVVTPTCTAPQVLQGGVCVTPTPVCTAPQVLQNGVCVTPVVTTPAPTVSVSISQPKVSVGSTANVTWTSTNATSCVGADGLSGTKAINSSEVITPTAGGQYTYTISCTGAGGSAKQSVALVVPIPVQATSYLNAKNLNMPSVKYPVYEYNTAQGYGEGLTGGVAFGDFFQDGKIAMVAFTNRWMTDQTKKNPAGTVYFYKFDVNGNPVDHTADILKDVTGCEAPRKVLVADFNGDGKPDVYASCTGAEFGPNTAWIGEQTRILLSQPDGSYKNEATGLNCYCHTATAADINGDGKVDIITSDWLLGIKQTDPFNQTSSVMILTNDGTGHFAIKQDTNFQVVPQTIITDTSTGTLYKTSDGFGTIELVDVDGDGKPDLLVGSSDDNNTRFQMPHYIFKNNGNGTFSEYATFRTGNYTNFVSIDINVRGSDLYIYGANNEQTASGFNDYTSLLVIKYNLNSKSVSTIWNSHGQKWTNVIVASGDIGPVMYYNGNLVPTNAAYGVSIPLQ